MYRYACYLSMPDHYIYQLTTKSSASARQYETKVTHHLTSWSTKTTVLFTLQPLCPVKDERINKTRYRQYSPYNRAGSIHEL